MPKRAIHPVQQAAERWMPRVMNLARRGMALASPNPMVGAVLVRGRRVVGEGFHTYDGVRHAEIVALDAAGKAARGATLYINLEPCCHRGRTGPCTRALIEAGISRVVAAMADPNPAVAGRGFKQLRAAGIAVDIAKSFTSEAERLNEAFALWVTTGRPFVTLKSAMTLDGALMLPAEHEKKSGKTKRRRRWITSTQSRAEVHRMRNASDAVLTGIGTVLADDPLLTDRSGLPRRRKLLRVVVDSTLRLSPRSRVARTADNDVLVFTCASETSSRASALRRAGVEVIRLPDRGRRPDLRKVLAELGKRGILSVLLEAGSTLNRAALSLKLVDKARLFYAPILAHAPGEEPLALFRVRLEQFGPDIAVEGYLRNG